MAVSIGLSMSGAARFLEVLVLCLGGRQCTCSCRVLHDTTLHYAQVAMHHPRQQRSSSGSQDAQEVVWAIDVADTQGPTLNQNVFREFKKYREAPRIEIPAQLLPHKQHSGGGGKDRSTPQSPQQRRQSAYHILCLPPRPASPPPQTSAASALSVTGQRSRFCTSPTARTPDHAAHNGSQAPSGAPPPLRPPTPGVESPPDPEAPIRVEDLPDPGPIGDQLEGADTYQRMCLTLAAATEALVGTPAQSAKRIALLEPALPDADESSSSTAAAGAGSSASAGAHAGGSAPGLGHGGSVERCGPWTAAGEPPTPRRLLDEAVQRAPGAPRHPLAGETIPRDASVGYLQRLRERLEAEILHTAYVRESVAVAPRAVSQRDRVAHLSSILGADYPSFVAGVGAGGGERCGSRAGGHGVWGREPVSGSGAKAVFGGGGCGPAAKAAAAKPGHRRPRPKTDQPSIEQTILLRHCVAGAAPKGRGARARGSDAPSVALRTLMRLMGPGEKVISLREQAKIVDAVVVE